MTLPTSLALAAVAPPVTASASGRTIDGLAVTYHEVGHTSVGPLRVRAGAIRLPAELSRVKLVDEHQSPPVAVGFLTAAAEEETGLRTSFRVANTPRGQVALEDALEGARDSLSVELTDVTYDAAGYVSDALLTAVALVTVPAFAGARIDRVAASLTPPSTAPTSTDERHDMTDEQRSRLEALRAQDTMTQDEAAELAGLAADEHEAPADEPAEPATETAAAERPAVSASMPAGLPGRGVARHTVRDLAAATARVLTGQSRPHLEAALSNITQTANEFATPDGYAGELWSGLTYTRRYVPMMATSPLTSYKVRGWRWVVAPEVADYAGDKTAVPSNQPTTEDVDVIAARLAGAHDIDRKFVDFGDTEFIASYYNRMTDSYAVKSDQKARAALIAAANANVYGTTANSLLKALMLARVALITYEDDSFAAGEPDWFLVNSTDYVGLLDVTTAQVPAFLTDLGIDPTRIVPTASVPAGSVMAGVKAANTFYELGQTPIRVEAINVANGGIDGGVFGYWATLSHHVKGAVRVNFTA